MRLLALAMSFVSVSAFACPDLTGSYPICRMASGELTSTNDVIISQTELNGITTYSYASTDTADYQRVTVEITADGQPYSEDVTDPETNVTYTETSSVHCMGEILHIVINTSHQGQALGTTNVEVNKTRNQLIQKTYGSFMGHDFSETTVCE